MVIMKTVLLLAVVLIPFSAMAGQPRRPVNVPFQKNYAPTWAADHIKLLEGGKRAELVLDKWSGTGFQSKGTYLFGHFSMQIKMVAGDSAGTVTAFYLSSQNAEHDEIDFEFLGNRSGQPYILQTNVYTGGKGDREQRIYLWFDPTADYHSYAVLWNMYQIVFFVDYVPIRVFKNSRDLGVRYPFNQPMKIYSSLWNADDWATRGGLDKTDWSKAPFIASYRGFYIDGCEASVPQSACPTLGRRWWDQEDFRDLDGRQYRYLKWVRRNFTIYNYCNDRFELGLQYAEHRNLNSALSHAKEFLDMTAGSLLKGWRLLALILSAQKRYSEAEIVLDAALDETGKWEQGVLLRTKAKLQIAQSSPMHAIETYRLLLALVQAQRKSFGSGKCTLKAEDERVHEVEVWRDLAGVYSGVSHWRDAEICLDKAKVLKLYSAETLHTQGVLYEARGRKQEALAAYINALSVDVDHVPCKVSIGALLWRTGGKSLCVARSFLSDALRLEPTNHAAWYYLGMVHKADGRTSDAADCFQAACMLEESAPIEKFTSIC